ncbi:transmembrane protein, putative (macronuclear) [Tetrahymena thermophila SB210]|uniref:Transmembrane protein, putative n=1 Tax=Tetrahymena thermophila (strain SB210) TaxID=312017 RepID=W7XEL3_TETTS|nr:transmembrane protein, putative [Tetrahymena thermophila SB210]EWS75143.1 transmembrane protein, putative [Tetrahymena thermophila SB210]|eukprot:XP_012652299.1 transmembrane protein, putative [Tetrahymena thermophila SB210]
MKMKINQKLFMKKKNKMIRKSKLIILLIPKINKMDILTKISNRIIKPLKLNKLIQIYLNMVALNFNSSTILLMINLITITQTFNKTININKTVMMITISNLVN